MMERLKARIFKLLREDEEFRYAVAGMLGLEDIRSSIGKLVEVQLRVEERLSGLEGRADRLEDALIKLADAQKATEERLGRLESAHVRLTERVDALAEAQRRTEESLKVLEEHVGRLESAHVRLTERVDALAEAQRRTEESLKVLEEHVGRLESAHVRLTERVDALAEAQRRTEESLKVLAEQVSNLSREVGRLSDVVGFGLEDIARVVVPGWLYRHEGIMVDELVRRFFYVDGVEVEVNLYGEGVKEGRRIVVIGEARSRIYRREVLDFYRSVEKVLETVKEPVYLFMFAYFIHPSAEEEARSRGIRLIASYMR